MHAKTKTQNKVDSDAVSRLANYYKSGAYLKYVSILEYLRNEENAR